MGWRKSDQARVTHGVRVGQWQHNDWCVWATSGAWRRMFLSQKLQSPHVLFFLAILGWVLLGIGHSITLCLCFSSLMNRIMKSERCKDCGRDNGNSLLTVATGWRRGQWKNTEDDCRYQNVRAMDLIPC